MHSTKTPSILFVCAGNTCRSPIAKALAQKLFGDDVYIGSAGIDTISKLPAVPEAVQVIAEEGININHQSLTLLDIEASQWNVVVAMDPRIARSIKASRLISADYLVEWDVIDPYSRGKEAYRYCVENIKLLLLSLLSLLKDKPQSPSLIYSLRKAKNDLNLEDYVITSIGQIKSGKITEGSHFKGVEMKASLKLEERLRSELERNLKEHKMSYHGNISKHFIREKPFGKLTLGEVIRCYKFFTKESRKEAKVVFNQKTKVINSTVINQLFRIARQRNERAHGNIDSALEILRDIELVIM